jgi:hypothetical protein
VLSFVALGSAVRAAHRAAARFLNFLDGVNFG